MLSNAIGQDQNLSPKEFSGLIGRYPCRRLSRFDNLTELACLCHQCLTEALPLVYAPT